MTSSRPDPCPAPTDRRRALALGAVALLTVACFPDATLLSPSTSTGGHGGQGGQPGGGGSTTSFGGGGSATTTSGGAGGQGGGAGCIPANCPGIDTTCSYRACDENDECAMALADEATPCTEDGGELCNATGECVECLTEEQCSGTDLCVLERCVPEACQNDEQDGDETDVDCGGPECSPCANTFGCALARDCQSGFCDGVTCAPCAADDDCAGQASKWCDPTLNDGQCRDQYDNGVGCARDGQCRYAHCAPLDNVCCDTACSSLCEACLFAKTGSPNGTCDLVTGGTDPDVECTAAPQASCGNSGAGCRGDANACSLWPGNTVCIPSTCSAGQEVTAGLCNGAGTCVPGTQQQCTPYVCDAGGTACLTSCSSSTQCVSSHYCDSPNCVVDEGVGTPCTEAAQCDTNHCPAQDGVCCDLPCDGECESCAGADTCGTDGTCAPIVAGTDPLDECSGAPVCFGGACGTGAIAFVTSQNYTGNLGGLAGADAICQGLADAACLPGTYAAWLSTTTASPSTRFTQQTVPYRLVTGTIVADNWTDLTDGSLDSALTLDERGQTPLPSSTACGPPVLVLSATTVAGAGNDPAANACTDWTSTTGASAITWGFHDDATSWWSYGCGCGGPACCSFPAHIYCFQQ